MIVAVAEGWTAVLGGLIPILSLAGIGYVIWRAVRDGDNDEEE